MARKSPAKPDASATPAEAPATPKVKATPKSITVLVAEPKLRGSRAKRWSLVTKAKDTAELAELLKAGGWKQTVAGTTRWLTKAKLISLD